MNDLIGALKRLKVQTGSLACLGCGHEHNCSTHGCAIIREAAEMLEKSQWISVEDRFPDDEFYEWADQFSDGNVEPFEVIVTISGAEFATVLFYCPGGSFSDIYGADYKVTHWMPLPEPPKEVQSDA